MEPNWIPLTKYSNKYNISISTLRRRIKSQKVEFISRNGKYLLLDSPLDHHKKRTFQKKDVENYVDKLWTKNRPVDNTVDELCIDDSDVEKAVDNLLIQQKHKEENISWEQKSTNSVDKSVDELCISKINLEKSVDSLLIQNKDVVWNSQEDPLPLYNDDLKAISNKEQKEEISQDPGTQEVLTTTRSLLDELKKAYSLIIQGKDEQIFFIKNEIADLKTLVCALEDENHRLRNPKSPLSHTWS